ncbi:MAG: 50S ribosomal protein L1 [Actinomycetota bacterium]
MSGKRYREALAKVDREKEYAPADAIRILKDLPAAKFDESVEVAFRLGVDTTQAEQALRGTVALPHGTGKTVRVAAFATGEKAREAREAGADVVGGDDLVEQVIGGTIEFDAAVATPDMMAAVGKAGRVLGPRGLMPNPKTGTVTFDIAKAVTAIKGGQLEYKTDKSGIVHLIIGKRSFGEQQLLENLHAVAEEIVRARPSAAKGKYVISVALSTTMGPGIRLDPSHVREVEAAQS